MLENVTLVLISHNSEKTIERTLRSIEPNLNSGMKLIIIDDDSTDKTFHMSRAWAKGRASIIVEKIHRNGSAGARNYGLSKVATEFVMFCDSDDEVLFEDINALDSSVLPEHDVIVHDYVFVDALSHSTQRRLEMAHGKNEISTKSEFIQSLLMKEMGFWRYVYRTEFLKRNNIRFVGELSELRADYFVLDDYFFLLKVLSTASSIYYAPSAIYKYYANSNASIEKFKVQSRFMARAALIQLGEIGKLERHINKKWLGNRLNEQLCSSFATISLKHGARHYWEFSKSISEVDRKLLNKPLLSVSKSQVELVILFARKCLRFLR